MSRELEALENRMRRLESQNRSLWGLCIALAVLALAATAWGQTAKSAPLQAQQFELRDDSGRLRAELAILNGGPALRFFDVDGDVECLLSGDSFNIFKKGGDNQAVFAKNGLSFGDGKYETFVRLDADEKKQMGELFLNNKKTGTYTTVNADDLAPLHTAKAR